MSEKVMQILADQIVKKLEAGVVPWRKPWKGGATPGVNPITWTKYRGYNWLATYMAGRNNRYWLTLNQLRALGGHMNKGQSPTLIIYFKILEKDRPGQEEPDLIPMLRYYKVWNIEQCTIPEGALPEEILHDGEQKDDDKLTDEQRIAQCEAIYSRWKDKPPLVHNDQRAYYSPHTDLINMPRFETFRSPEEYYSTLFHEMTHATGHKDRLNRDGVTRLTQYGSQIYGKEELVAELGAARLCYHTKIENKTIDNSASYIDNWMRAIKKSPAIVYQAAQAAEKAYTHIIGDTPTDDDAQR